MELKTPHIPLGISLDEGMKILRLTSVDIYRETGEKEDFYKICLRDYECGFYARDGIIHSSWYDDPVGRNSEAQIIKKVTLYLSRYGNVNDWESGINNGWIQFFRNETTGIGMSYGLHKDVLRFNYL